MASAWYALRVRSNFERTTATFLTSNGHESFLPTYRERRKWSDRVKEADMPLFRGYVFSRFDTDLRQTVVRAPGFLNIVGAGNTFLPVPDAEIQAIQAIVNSPAFRTPWPYLCIGERVVIDRGALSGLEGILVEQKNAHRVIVSVHLLQRSVAVEVSLDCVRPLKRTFRIPFEAGTRATPLASLPA